MFGKRQSRIYEIGSRIGVLLRFPQEATEAPPRRTFQFLFPNSSRQFAYLKIPIKDRIDRFQFQLTTKLVSSNSLFPIPFLAHRPFLIFIRLFLFQIHIFNMCL